MKMITYAGPGQVPGEPTSNARLTAAWILLLLVAAILGLSRIYHHGSQEATSASYESCIATRIAQCVTETFHQDMMGSSTEPVMRTLSRRQAECGKKVSTWEYFDHLYLVNMNNEKMCHRPQN